MIRFETGQPILLKLTLEDGDLSQFCLATIIDAAGSIVTTVALSHVLGGLYQGTLAAQPAGVYSILYEVYTDGTFVTLSGYQQKCEDLFVDVPTADQVWDEPIQGHIAIGTAGESHINGQSPHVRDDVLSVELGTGLPKSFRRRYFDTAANADASTPGLTGETGEIFSIDLDGARVSQAVWTTLRQKR